MQDGTPGSNTPADNSAAAKIAGTFEGSGKYMPQGINLGLVKGCTLPSGWESNFKTGNSTIDITKASDSTIMLTLTSGPFPKFSYGPMKVAATDNSVTFPSGSYIISSKKLNFSAYTEYSLYITSNVCLIGLPYLYGFDLLGSGSYSFQTIDHVDFSGTKQ